MGNFSSEIAWCNMVEKTSSKLAAQQRRVDAMLDSDPRREGEVRVLAAMRLNASAARLNRESIREELRLAARRSVESYAFVFSPAPEPRGRFG